MLQNRFGKLVGSEIIGVIYDDDAFIGFKLMNRKNGRCHIMWVYGDEEGNHPGWPNLDERGLDGFEKAEE
jgi:hypothetical protein